MTLRTAGIAAVFALALSPLAASAGELGVGVNMGLDASTDARTSASLRASTTMRMEAGARGGDRIAAAQARAGEEIDRRIKNLAALSTRFGEMQKLASSSQATLSASLESQISALTALKAKIDADDSTTTLKADIQSIAKSYRIYALIMPQAALTAAAGRVENVANLLTQFSAKLATRIGAGADASLQASLTDMNTKIADASVQAKAAVSGVASLAPDNGDQSVAAANTAALKAARAKIQAAQQDLVAARKDAGAIVKALGSAHAAVTASTTTSVEAGQ
ncbi:MAG: hypothetical protein KGI78_01320 [Patescibacteria group bacterium]|nr:hypothetical protein [Patescibacteria group bacterium]MDE1944377.1 hypothetical protein [Patescibacteria group bacterium]MDE1944994.1 hypothetical protein [Patescibacteria group bacterium]MDE2057474.1 hypothetical protein [Patescibacteria group bacterium]